MKCPKCKSPDLHPTKMEQGLSAMGCNKCQGVFVSLLYYRDWAERFGIAATTESVQAEEVQVEDAENTRAAMGCPKCSRIMTKYRISSGHDNRLDLCANCDEAWLDKGEWSLLKSLNLGAKIPAVFTEQWQRQVRQQVTEENRRKRFVEALGEETVKEADKVRQWIAKEPKRAQILQYLSYE
ncbi:MAG: zf-TFIIB domain-containing protein [Oleispira sp.]